MARTLRVLASEERACARSHRLSLLGAPWPLLNLARGLVSSSSGAGGARVERRLCSSSLYTCVAPSRAATRRDENSRPRAPRRRRGRQGMFPASARSTLVGARVECTIPARCVRDDLTG